jgi:hypothetical protein
VQPVIINERGRKQKKEMVLMVGLGILIILAASYKFLKFTKWGEMIRD